MPVLHEWHTRTASLHGELADAEPSFDNLRTAILGISQHIGRAQAEAILARFGAKAITAKPNVPGLDETQYPQAFALCLEVLAGRVDATSSAVAS
ncbi:hypothetical protein AWB75_05398 [Caballeronia catudaia]|uniref:Uncharacterized protein n=1 Tax=Caballeronia catudaia TaxID=1777136 RepID=A0A158CM49_9BURK|nr:hypothetical protein [Caballeronia catudaia]SAK83371.1 hypothetical protein AWB75_05398 [Caballeronia catudaia]